MLSLLLPLLHPPGADLQQKHWETSRRQKQEEREKAWDKISRGTSSKTSLCLCWHLHRMSLPKDFLILCWVHLVDFWKFNLGRGYENWFSKVFLLSLFPFLLSPVPFSLPFPYFFPSFQIATGMDGVPEGQSCLAVKLTFDFSSTFCCRVLLINSQHTRTWPLVWAMESQDGWLGNTEVIYKTSYLSLLVFGVMTLKWVWLVTPAPSCFWLLQYKKKKKQTAGIRHFFLWQL